MTTQEYEMQQRLYAEADPAIVEKFEGKCGIYGIWHRGTLVYVGKSTNMFHRWVAHKINALEPTARDYNTKMYTQLRKAKEQGDELTFGLIEECSKAELDARERYYISLYMPALNKRVPCSTGWRNKVVQDII